MDPIIAADIHPASSSFWPAPAASDPTMNAWHPHDDIAEDDIRAWDQHSGDAAPEEDEEEEEEDDGDGDGVVLAPDSDAYAYSSFRFGDAGFLGHQNSRDWNDLENPSPISRRHGEKRKSDGDGSFDPSAVSQAPSNKGRSSGTGSLFFKTKLCIKFRAGTCPYNSNCNFAHGMEELRKPPPGWEEMVAAQEGGAGSSGGQSIKENAAGQLVLSSSDSQRFRRTRRCKKYYSEEGCPYGERCSFLHDDQAKARESNAISLGPGTGNASMVVSAGVAAATNTSTGTGTGTNNGSNGGERPTNWKTRMCNKWEMTGHCPFGQKCNFAHGVAELQVYSGASADYYEGAAASAATNSISSENKQAARTALLSKADVVGSSYVSTTTYPVDGHAATLRHKSSNYLPSSKTQKPAKLLENWKGPADQISTIYGDWIEDEE